jgi:signal transduction histidine kinase
MSLPKGWPKPTKGNKQSDTDWAICLVRWGLLVCIPAVAFLDPAHRFSPYDLALFTLAFAAYNLTITVLLALGFLTTAMPIFTLGADTVASLVLVYLSGGAGSPLFFVPLLPILVATVRFGGEIGLLLAAVFSLSLGLQTALAWEAEQGIMQIFPTVLQVLMLALAAVAGSATHKRLAGGGEPSQAEGVQDRLAVPERVKMVYELAATLSATLNYERVLEAILDISRLGFDELGYRVGESAGLVLLYDKDGLLYPASYRNLVVQDDANQRIKGLDGIVGQSIAQAQAAIGGGPAADPELKAFRSLERCKSMICVPLRAGFETYGAVLFASVRSDVYTSEHLDLLLLFCNQATIALQNANLYQRLREERDKIIDKEEEARHKLARDLHDGPTQDIAAIAMRLNFARLLMERDPTRARAELARLEDLAHRTVKEIRSMLFTLRPIILETEGLVAALNQYADNLRENDKLPVEVDAEHYRDCLDSEAQGVVFAIVEEAVNNAKKHAQASHIWVQLAVQGDMFVAQVVDNGRGFDVQAVERDYGSKGSLGMVNLRERAELVGGTLNIESTSGQGTRVTLIVPLEEQPV